MKTLLRSAFSARADDDRELLLRNYQALLDSGLVFDTTEDTVIWSYLQTFVTSHQHVPDIGTLRAHFTHLRQEEVTNRVEVLANQPLKTRGDFLTSLNTKVDEQKTVKVIELLKDASRIVQTGIEFDEGKGKKTLMLGPQAAIRFLMDRGHDIVAPTTGTRLSGEVTSDGLSFMQEYDRVESDPLSGIGQFTGIPQIDQCIRGAKRGELWTHAAYTGGLKSTFSFNWMYNQAIYYRHSSLMFSLEMPYTQDRRIFYALHTAHEKFADVRKGLGLGPFLDYSRIRDGALDTYTDEQFAALPDAIKRQAKSRDLGGGRILYFNPARPEYTFLKEYVVKDLKDPKNQYGSIFIEVFDPDKSDFTVADLRNKAEMLYAKDPSIAMTVVDHAGLMAPRHRKSSTTENLNEVIRDLKRMSMGFNRGLGMAMVSMFQISREGYKAAIKTDGRYNLTHLSYANEAERSSDIVTTTFVDDDLKQRGLVRWQCLKTRDDEPFNPFYSYVRWPCRLIAACHDVSVEEVKSAGSRMDDNRLLLADD